VVSDSGLPVMYKVFPGSIPDVKTLVNLLADLRGMGMEEVRLVLDRGFYSLNNLHTLVESAVAVHPAITVQPHSSPPVDQPGT